MIYDLSWGQLRRLRAKGPDEPVRVYTFQHPAAWEAALERGYLTGAGESHQDPELGMHYGWMRERMRDRVPGFSGDMPVWAYLARPNLRQREYSAEARTLVVADVPRARMLVSDYNRWNQALNLSYVVDTEPEMEALVEAGLQVYPAETATPGMVASWDAIFDLDHSTWSPGKLSWCGPPLTLQACVDRIHLHEVVRAGLTRGRVGRNRPPFESRPRPRAGDTPA